MADGPDLTGELLDDRFRLEARVSVTRFGDVFHGRDELRDVECTIDVLRLPEGERESETARAMLRESLRIWAQVGPKLPKQGMPRLFGFALPPGRLEDGAICYVASEWVGGETLGASLERRRRDQRSGRPAQEVVDLLDGVVEALAAIHAAGGAHGALHPRIIRRAMRDRVYEPKLVDVGLEAALRTARQPFDAHTDIYRAPEQLAPTLGESGARSDVYSLALIILEMLSDRAPFEATTLGEFQHAALDPLARPTPAVLGVELGPIASDVLVRATSLEPRSRFEDGGTFWGTFKAAVLRDAGRSMPPRGRTSAPPSAGAGAPLWSIPPMPAAPANLGLEEEPVEPPPPIPSGLDVMDTVLTQGLPSSRSLQILEQADAAAARLTPAGDGRENLRTEPIPFPAISASSLPTPPPSPVPPLLRPQSQISTGVRADRYLTTDSGNRGARWPMIAGITAGVVLGGLLVAKIVVDPGKPGPTPAPSTSASNATGTSASAPNGSASAASSASAAPPDAYELERALHALDDRIPNCRQAVGPSGIGSVRATFDGTGTVTDLAVDPPYAGTSRGACIAGLFRTAKGPVYKGPARDVPHRFFLAP